MVLRRARPQALVRFGGEEGPIRQLIHDLAVQVIFGIIRTLIQQRSGEYVVALDAIGRASAGNKGGAMEPIHSAICLGERCRSRGSRAESRP